MPIRNKILNKLPPGEKKFEDILAIDKTRAMCYNIRA